MRNIAYILAFLLVCPTLLFATQTMIMRQSLKDWMIL